MVLKTRFTPLLRQYGHAGLDSTICSSNISMVALFFSIIFSFSDVILNPIVKARVTLKLFKLRFGMYVVTVDASG